jgi:5'(3')-deoxyribonucleotidase
MDGVLLDLVGGICSALRAEYGADLTPEDVDEWDMSPLLDPIVGRNWMRWLRDRDLWSTFPAVEGAIGAVEQLRREGHYLEIVTSKPEWAEDIVWRWIAEHRLPVQRVTIVNKDAKSAATDADVLIDDYPPNCIGWAESDPNRSALLFDAPYNRADALVTGVKRVTGWSHAAWAVRELLA